MSRKALVPVAPLRLELENEWAWCGDRRLDLTPRAFAVLRHLASHPGRLVTKRELFDAIWGDTIVSEAALASCIRDVRRALQDSSRSPRYLETVHRRGFRFIGPLGGASPLEAAPPLEGAPPEVPARSVAAEARPGAAPQRGVEFVGRAGELARLHTLFAAALAGRRQIVFVTGEAGIGKTTLVETFLADVGSSPGLRVGRGQCVEHYGSGEAYLPVLEALGRLGRASAGDSLVRTLRQIAPTWLAQLPALLSDDDLAAVQRRVFGSTRERMLRELSEALDALCQEAPFVVVLEDLHWSDSATIDLLAMLARRREPARLMVLGTMRPADLAASGHPLRAVEQELALHGRCEEVALDFLNEAAVAEYLARRLPGAAFPARLVRALQRNTGGNPLFLVNVVDDLVARGQVRETAGGFELAVAPGEIAADVPRTLWQIVDKQVERLSSPEQAMLALASVAGAEFSAALASVDGIPLEEAEQACSALARRGQLLRDLGVAEWPDGTLAARFGFIHALYRNVLYGRVEVGRRVGLHARIGARLEQAYGARAGEVAGELAMHFEQGRDFERAVRYRRQAAANALAHHGNREAAGHATRALEILGALPESLERTRQELALCTIAGAALIPMGSTAPEVAGTYARARELCSQVGVTPELFPALVGLLRYYVSRAELSVAGELAAQLAALADASGDAGIRLGAYNASGIVAFYEGDFTRASEQLERGVDLYDPQRHSAGRRPVFWGGHDTGVSCTVHAAWALWALGYPARAAAKMQQGIERARATGFPFTLANACTIASTFHAVQGDAEATRLHTDEAVRQADEYGFELILQAHAMMRGWLRCAAGAPELGLEQMRAGLAAFRDHGAGIGLPTFLGLLASACATAGRAEEGLELVATALDMSERTGARYWDAELRRLRGELLLAGEKARRAGRRAAAGAASEAEQSFRQAIEIARGQRAKTLELRAVTSLGKLWREQGRAADARSLVGRACDSFEEGFELPDLTAARAVIESLP